MARIAGVNIPTDKRVHIALTYIHGIGNTKAKEITTALGIDEMARVNQLSDDQVVAIREKIDADYLVEGELRTQVRMNIKRLQDMKCTAVFVTVANFRSVVSAPAVTLAPVRVKPWRLQVRRSNSCLRV